MHLIHTPRWKCDWCGKTASRKKSIERHEATCFTNPAKRACKTCKHDHKEPDGDSCYCEIDSEQRPWAFNPDGPTQITCCSNCPDWEPKK